MTHPAFGLRRQWTASLRLSEEKQEGLEKPSGGWGGQGEGAVRGVWRAREHQDLRAYNYKLLATLAGLELKLSIPLLADMPVARHCTNRCGGMLTLCNFNTC